MLFSQWLFNEENPHLPPELKMKSIKISPTEWKQQLKINNKPMYKTEIQLPLRSEDEEKGLKILEYFTSGKLIWIEFVEEKGYKPESFMSQMKVTGILKNGEVDWHGAWGAWIKNEPVKLRIEVLLLPRQEPLLNEDKDELAKYATGYFAWAPPDYRHQVEPSDKMYQRGRYDALHFYVFGTSIPGHELTDVNDSYSNPIAFYTDNIRPTVRKLFYEFVEKDYEINGEYNKNTNDYVNYFGDKGLHYWDQFEQLARSNIAKEVMVNKKSIGVIGAKNIIANILQRRHPGRFKNIKLNLKNKDYVKNV